MNKITAPYTDVIADFIIDEAYENCHVLPLVCILSGSTAYGLNIGKSDNDYLGVHMMETHECLQHPDFRRNLQVIRKNFFENMAEVPVGEKGGCISLDSFEVWKFISLYLKGSFVAYELMYMPTIHCDEHSGNFIELMREGCTNRIGKAAKGNAFHDWRRNKANRKKTIMAYYRLIQAILFLREGDFVWDAHTLWDYAQPSGLINRGEAIFASYMHSHFRDNALTSIEIAEAGKEIEGLVGEVDRAMVVTSLPDQCPRKILDGILHRVQKTRLGWV